MYVEKKANVEKIARIAKHCPSGARSGAGVVCTDPGWAELVR